MIAINLGGEGEVTGAVNQQGPWVLRPTWRTVSGQTLSELLAAGHALLVCDNRALPIAAQSVDVVYTNNVPIDVVTFLGPGVQSSEVQRILKVGGRWVDNGRVRYTRP